MTAPCMDLKLGQKEVLDKKIETVFNVKTSTTHLTPEHPSDFLQAAKERAEGKLLPFLLCGHQKCPGFWREDYRPGGQVHHLSTLRTHAPGRREASSGIHRAFRHETAAEHGHEQEGGVQNERGVSRVPAHLITHARNGSPQRDRFGIPIKLYHVALRTKLGGRGWQSSKHEAQRRSRWEFKA